jgi:hypothetical protein
MRTPSQFRQMTTQAAIQIDNRLPVACRASACLPPRTAQAAKARSNGTVDFALSLLGSLFGALNPAPSGGSRLSLSLFGRSVTDRDERPPGRGELIGVLT